MLLKDFIKETLVNITQGVEEANEVSNRFELSDKVHASKGISGTNVEFEVNVIATESATKNKEGKASAGISVKLASFLNAEAGGGGAMSKEDANSNQSSHSLKFQVFISEKE